MMFTYSICGSFLTTAFAFLREAGMQHARRGPAEAQAVRRLGAPLNNGLLPEIVLKPQRADDRQR